MLHCNHVGVRNRMKTGVFSHEEVTERVQEVDQAMISHIPDIYIK